MMCRSRNWSNRGIIVEHDAVLPWDIYVGNYPLLEEVGPENMSASGKWRQYS